MRNLIGIWREKKGGQGDPAGKQATELEQHCPMPIYSTGYGAPPESLRIPTPTLAVQAHPTRFAEAKAKAKATSWVIN